MSSAAALFGVATLASHLRLLPERDPHPAIYDSATLLFDALDDPGAMLAGLVRFELALLGELGFGLDLSACASTGSPHDLAFVSPKSGRAVGRLAGERYRTKLLALPPFLLPAAEGDDAASATIIPTEGRSGRLPPDRLLPRSARLRSARPAIAGGARAPDRLGGGSNGGFGYDRKMMTRHVIRRARSRRR
jgi:DNA repair protein RecO (recombination protein O)